MNEYTNRTCGIGLPDKSPKGQRQEVIDLTIGIFFDGTCNNKYNSGSGKDDDDSYTGTWTNVAKLWDGYYYKTTKLIEKVYLEGIGTVTSVPIAKDEELAEKWEKGEVDIDDEKLESSGKGDDTYQGTGFGFESNGINAKIERACKLAMLKLNKMINHQDYSGKTINSIVFDVFGFSRGAAAARSFASRLKEKVGSVDEGRDVYLKLNYLNKNNKFKDVEIKVRFMGLFDTVSSFHPEFSRKPNFNNDVGELALNIPSYVDNIVHLVAADEYRANFALTTIDSAGYLGVEIVLPGAHSDIGGGYALIEKEKLCMNAFMRDRSWRGYLNFNEIVSQRWIPQNTIYQCAVKAEQINKNSSIRGSRSNTDAEFLLRNEIREVLNVYTVIPLNIMGKHASKKGNVQFLKDVVKDWDCSVADLCDIKKRIDTLADAGKGLYNIDNNLIQSSNRNQDDENLILNARARYIHLSAHNNGFSNYVGGVHAATDDNRRVIIQG